MLEARRWLELWQRLGVPRQADGTLAETFRDLTTRYAEPHRHYHTTQHISECLAKFEGDGVRALSQHPDEIELALWFHDAVYDTRAHDNEKQSARWAVETLSKIGAQRDCQQRVEALIMATCHDALPDTQDARVLVDIDLSILGAGTARFDEYEQQVRAEYAWVPEFMFRRTRKKILKEFLARPSIYSTDLFRQKLEQPARNNLERSLRALG